VSRTRLILLTGVAALAGAAAIVVLDTGGDSQKPVSRFAGVPQHGDMLGNPAAAATVVVFADPQCAFCRDWVLGTLPRVIADFVRPGRINLVYRGIEVIGPNSEIGLRAIDAAGRQNKLWDLADSLYRAQGAENSNWITNAVITKAASSVGADAKAILGVLWSSDVTDDLSRAAQEAIAAGVGGAPTFLLRRRVGQPELLQLSALDPKTFETTLRQELP
jgi:protein-disulfide isomerase